MGWMLWWKRKRKWTPEEMKSIDEGRAESVVRNERIRSQSRLAGDSEATASWKVDMAIAAELLDITKNNATELRATYDGLGAKWLAEAEETRADERTRSLTQADKRYAESVRHTNKLMIRARRTPRRIERMGQIEHRWRITRANAMWGLRTASAAVESWADTVIRWPENLWSWFWRSVSVRWTMIFVCAFAGVVMSYPLWGWLLFGAPDPLSQSSPPTKPGIFWGVLGVLIGIPYLAACARVSEEVDIRNGAAWPVHGKAWWMAAGRVLRRAIGLSPVTALAAVVGFEGFNRGLLWIFKIAPTSQPLWATAPDVEKFVVGFAFPALVIVIAWWLCVKFLTRGTSPSPGLGATSARDTFFDVGEKIGAFVRGAVFIGFGVALGMAYYWWGGNYSPSGRDIFGLNDSIAMIYKIGQWLVYAIVVVSAFMGLREWRVAFSGFARLNNPQTHGRARWATFKELKDARLSPHTGGIYLGEFLDGKQRETVGYRGPVHLMTIGPNGSGKGMGLIIPNVASLRRSILIIDPKGQAAAITARARAKLGPVKIINPFDVLVDTHPHLKSTGFNPLAALDPNDGRFTDDCLGIARALVREEFGSNAAFFSGSAQDLVTALVMHEKIERGNEATLGNVRKMLAPGLTTDSEGKAAGLAKVIVEMTESENETLKLKAARFKTAAKSNLEVIQSATNETRLLDSPLLQRDLAGEAIDWNLMKRELTTVYLILPADFLESHSAYLRLVVTSALRSLLRTPPSNKLPPVLFMLDEFAQLGYMPSIENAMGIARDFGVQLWVILQDLNQLHMLYKDRWQTFVGARGALTAFAPRDLFTARYLADLCGTQTVIVESQSERQDGKMGRSHGPQGLPLLRPEDLMEMSPGTMLCFSDPVKNPFLSHAPGYWDTLFARGLDRNPYYQPYGG